MAKGRALTIGLNAVDPKHYEGWSGKLNACEIEFEVIPVVTSAEAAAAVAPRL